MSAFDVAAGEQLSSARFRAARAADWDRLEDLLNEIERGRAASLSDDELFEMPVLYRATLSSLSVARETSLDADLISYLEALCTRAYFILYGVHAPVHRRAIEFLRADWPAAVRAIWRETLIAALLIAAGAVAAYLLVRSDPGWYYAIMPGELAGGRDPSSSVEALRKVLYPTEKDGLGFFATMLFTHNSQISIFSFALGFAFGVPTVLLMLYNGCTMGALMAVYVPKGLGWNLAAWLAIHGTTELFAIAIAGGAGLHIGMAVAFPGRLTRLRSAIAAGRTSGFAMLGVVVMLCVAGVLEGFGRQLIQDDLARSLIGGGMLIAWLCYFYAAGHRAEAEHG